MEGVWKEARKLRLETDPKCRGYASGLFFVRGKGNVTANGGDMTMQGARVLFDTEEERRGLRRRTSRSFERVRRLLISFLQPTQ